MTVELKKKYDITDVVTYLAEMLVQVGQSSGDDTSVTVAFSTARDGESLSTASLSIGKDCTIVTCQHTEKRRQSVLNQPKNEVFSMAS